MCGYKERFKQENKRKQKPYRMLNLTYVYIHSEQPQNNRKALINLATFIDFLNSY